MLLDKPRLAGLHFDDGPFVLVGVEVDVLALAHEPVKDRAKFREPLDALDAGDLAWPPLW